MDRMRVSEALDTGSIPVGRATKSKTKEWLGSALGLNVAVPIPVQKA